MKSILYVTLPGVLAQTLGSPVSLYNGGNLLYSNCAAKTSACDCHYASCSLSGDCACGWDDTTLTCKAGVTTKCVSCPAMRRCSVNEKLIIGPDGFPVRGQLSVWRGTPYPDNSGVVGQSSTQGQSSVASQTRADTLPRGDTTLSASYFGQPLNQNSGTQQVYGQPQQVYQPQPQTSPLQNWQQQNQLTQFTSLYPQAQSTQTQQVYQPQQTQLTSTQQVFGQPLSLYQDNPISPSACTAKTSPCDCHYASCSPAGDCLCGWDATTSTCRAGIPTQCASCPSMGRCGVAEPLLIGPDGFPIPGQLSVWGSVPYPDQSNQNQTNTYQANYQNQANTYQVQGQVQANTFPSSSYQSSSNYQNAYTVQPLSQPIQLSSTPAVASSTTTTTTTTRRGKGGKVARNQTIVG